MSSCFSRARLAAGLVAGLLALTACGGSDGAEPVEDPAEGSSGDADAGGVILDTGFVQYEAGTELTPYSPKANDPAVGQAAPVVEGQRFDGSAITIGGPTEQPTMYVFLAHWCPHCNDEIPELLELNDAGGLNDVDVVAISTAVASDRDNFPPSQWLDDKNWAWDAMADDEQSLAIIAYGGTSFPFVVLADTDGTVLARKAGSSSAADIRTWLDDNLTAA